MKPAKEILRALNVCSEEITDCRECPYSYNVDDLHIISDSCGQELLKDARTLIEYLLGRTAHDQDQ